MKLKKIILSGTIIAICSSSALLAAGNGSKPNGKPFIEIQGQFVEVVERIDNMEEYVNLELHTLKSRMTNLEADVDSIGSRVILLEQAIVDHQAQINTASNRIDALVASSSLQDQAIANAVADIEALETEITDLSSDVVGNSDLISAAEEEIQGIRNLLASEVQGLQAEIQTIENNTLAIASMQAELDALSVSINNPTDLTPQCPTGDLTTNADGSAVCVVTRSNGKIATTYFSPVVDIPAAGWREVEYYYGTYWSFQTYTEEVYTISCPSGQSLYTHPYMLEHVSTYDYYLSGTRLYYNYYYNYDNNTYEYRYTAYNNSPYNNSARISHSCFEY